MKSSLITGSRGDVFVVRTSRPVENLWKNGLFWSCYSFVTHSIDRKPRDWGLARSACSIVPFFTRHFVPRSPFGRRAVQSLLYLVWSLLSWFLSLGKKFQSLCYLEDVFIVSLAFIRAWVWFCFNFVSLLPFLIFLFICRGGWGGKPQCFILYLLTDL